MQPGQAVETIAAPATPPGYGGVGIIRVSGPLAEDISRGMLGRIPSPRIATLADFLDADGSPIDQGIALYFPAPASFTGENVLELQGHGGPIVMDLLLRRTLELGARVARPGEFSERAFHNGKLDLVQAEAIADLIESATETAARLAGRTLQGELSRRIGALVEELIELRTFLEATLDFPDEEVDLLEQPRVRADLDALITSAESVRAAARQGSLVREGLRVVIAGPPNAGKSSLLNALSGTEAAIVTDIPGTTRDLLREEIQIDGMPVHIVDTAGLRHAPDSIEQEGIRRAHGEIEQADLVLWVQDAVADPDRRAFDPSMLPGTAPVTFVRNKIDLSGDAPGRRRTRDGLEIGVSARTGAGLDGLTTHLKETAGFRGAAEGEFIARRRHLDALERAIGRLRSAAEVLEGSAEVELVAEDLRQAQQALGEITGAFTSDDLLGRIFSTFCIGK
jgi:tRNA modification GTPase